MLRPASSSLSLRANSIRNLNQLSGDHLEEILHLMHSSTQVNNLDRRNLNASNVRSCLASLNNINSVGTTDFKLNDKLVASASNLTTANMSVKPVHTSISNENQEHVFKDQITVYFKRWIILSVFCLITLLNAFNWIEYSIIQDVVIHFYNESLPSGKAEQFDATNWLSMVYMLTYIPLVFPAMFLLDRKGLKLSCILGALLTSIGCFIKLAAVRPNLFAVAMLGQTICGIAQSFTLGIPARLSALWFGPTEISTATSIGVFGNQLGTAIGFLIPPNVVTKSDSIEFMQRRFYYLLIPVAILCTLATVLSVIFVKDQPDKPPSYAQLEIRNKSMKNASARTDEDENDFVAFKRSLKNLFKNLNYCLILVSYGINTGTYYSIGTLLNQILTESYPTENEKIGWIGLILVLSGLIGAVIGGIILDRTKAFKRTTFVIYACSFGAMVLFTFTLKYNIWIVFGTSFLLGFFMTGYLPVGFELAAEVTYPESEGTSCGLLNTSAQIFGIFYTYTQSRITTAHGALAGNIFICASLLVGTVITALVKSDLRRQNALKTMLNNLNEENQKSRITSTQCELELSSGDTNNLDNTHEKSQRSKYQTVPEIKIEQASDILSSHPDQKISI